MVAMFPSSKPLLRRGIFNNSHAYERQHLTLPESMSSHSSLTSECADEKQNIASDESSKIRILSSLVDELYFRALDDGMNSNKNQNSEPKDIDVKCGQSVYKGKVAQVMESGCIDQRRPEPSFSKQNCTEINNEILKKAPSARRVIFPSLHNEHSETKLRADASNASVSTRNDTISETTSQMAASIESTISTYKNIIETMEGCDKEPTSTTRLDVSLPELSRMSDSPVQSESYYDIEQTSPYSGEKFVYTNSPSKHKIVKRTNKELPPLPMLSNGKASSFIKISNDSSRSSSTYKGRSDINPCSNSIHSPSSRRSIFPKSPKYDNCYDFNFNNFKPELEHVPAPVSIASPSSNVGNKIIISILRNDGRFVGRAVAPETDPHQVIVANVQSIESDRPTPMLAINNTTASPDHDAIEVSHRNPKGGMLTSYSPPLHSRDFVGITKPVPFSPQTPRAISEPWEKRTSFDPRVWVREFERSGDEWDSIWYKPHDMDQFKHEAMTRIVRYQKMQLNHTTTSTRLLPTGTGRVVLYKQAASSPSVAATSTRSKQQAFQLSRALFTHQALQVEAEVDTCTINYRVGSDSLIPMIPRPVNINSSDATTDR